MQCLVCCAKRIHVRRPQMTAGPAAASLCSICSTLRISSILRKPLPIEDSIPLGSLADILQKAVQCRFCCLVAALFRRSWCLDAVPNVDLSSVNCSLFAVNVGTLTNPDLEEQKQCQRLCIHAHPYPPEISHALTRGRIETRLEIQLLEEDAHKVRRAREIHGRRMADTVDIGLVKTWITLCEQEHGDECASPWWRGNEVQLPSFVRMVDVTLMMLVQAPSDCHYLALSYVWGTAGDSYWTTKANINLRAQSSGIDLSVLPATIQDAIQVTQALGERCLWIDALCIIQDSAEDKNVQIHVMELIYSGALLTIVAAGGESAHAKLPGVSAGSRPFQHIEAVQDLHLTVSLPLLSDAIAHSSWNTRGWTFQELLLSRRRLFFTKYQVYFECGKDVWCEDFIAESKSLPDSWHPMRYSGSGAGLFLSSPDEDCTTSYTFFVQHLTERYLTYQSDILYAATALTNAITRAYQLAGGCATEAFRYGMQIRNLDHSLLWQPRLYSTHARRVSHDMGIAAWPSWAWTSWIGAVFYSNLSQLTDTIINNMEIAKPDESLVRGWYLVDEHQRLVCLDVETISFCWTEDEMEDVTLPRYLAPEGDVIDQRLEPLPPIGTLIFRTQCAFFTVSERVENTSQGPNSLPHTIFNIHSDKRRLSAHVGRIILPSSTRSSTVLEFIVLSRCSGGCEGDDQGLYDVSIYGHVYSGCLLHVMAVRRAGPDTKVRERIGLGVIFEQAWLECSGGVETVFLC